MNKPRVAVCLSGEMRDYQSCDLALKQYLANYECDYFICAWDEVGGKGNKYDKTKVDIQDITNRYSPKVLDIQLKQEWDKNRFLYKNYGGATHPLHPNGVYMDFISQYQTWYKLSLLFKQYAQKGVSYDFVIRTRPDLKIVDMEKSGVLDINVAAFHQSRRPIYCCEGTRVNGVVKGFWRDGITSADLKSECELLEASLQNFDMEEWNENHQEFLTSTLLERVAPYMDMSNIVNNMLMAARSASERAQSCGLFPGVSDQISMTSVEDYFKYTEYTFMTSILYKTGLLDKKINVLAWGVALANLQPIVVANLHHTLASNSGNA